MKYFRIFLCGLSKESLMTEGIGEYKVAATVGKVKSGLGAFAALRNVLLLDILNAHLIAGGLRGIDEVLVIG